VSLIKFEYPQLFWPSLLVITLHMPRPISMSSGMIAMWDLSSQLRGNFRPSKWSQTGDIRSSTPLIRCEHDFSSPCPREMDELIKEQSRAYEWKIRYKHKSRSRWKTWENIFIITAIHPYTEKAWTTIPVMGFRVEFHFSITKGAGIQVCFVEVWNKQIPKQQEWEELEGYNFMTWEKKRTDKKGLVFRHGVYRCTNSRIFSYG
jgi:hypothetical protein